ncbi:MAG: class I SAM-dependent methyltransferase family protein [Methanomicrobia archaeon]|nr:class I SAM-dependent methyltransferase family protein [Methanomicrobia archaeon]
MDPERLPCVKAAKREGEHIRQALLARGLLRTDAKISSDEQFIYLPLSRPLPEVELRELGIDELTTREFVIAGKRKRIEELLGFKPAFEVVGDIAVLTEAVDQSQEAAVADAIMALHRNIKVVAKRVSAVENVFRTRRLVTIAGEYRTETLHTENACRFMLDLETVYFNPRLAGERRRIATQAAQTGKPEEVIDMFAGVGPFTIQIAKRAPLSHITAIDINPEAIRYLTANLKLNRVENVDAIVGDVKEIYTRFSNTADRIIMNLPKSAYLFLREALSMLKPEGGIIHFYGLESAYAEEAVEKKTRGEALARVIELAKERLVTSVEDLGAEFAGYSLYIQRARKVKAYAPYAYIVGVDAEMRRDTLTRRHINPLYVPQQHRP